MSSCAQLISASSSPYLRTLASRVPPGAATSMARPVGRVHDDLVWDAAAQGVLRLPSGRLVRGRALRRPVPDDVPPEFGVYLLGKRPAPPRWDARWVRWPEFWLPADREDAQDALREAWHRAEQERVELGCDGGRGRTGTALAILAVLDGIRPREAVAFVREHYHPRAVETPWQRGYVTRFPPR